MKKLIQTIMAVYMFLGVPVAFAEKPVECADPIQPKELKELLEKSKLSGKEINKAYDALSRLFEKKVYTVKDLIELCLLYSKHDRSDVANTFAETIKDSNPEEFAKALKEFSAEDAKKIKELVEINEEQEEIPPQ